MSLTTVSKTNPPKRPTPARKKSAPRSRVRLTHFEIRRGDALRLRIAVSDETLADVGNELGALIKRVVPAREVLVPEPVVEADVVISRAHAEHDGVYHAELREHLAALFGSLCDDALEEALDIVRQERERRATGEN
jgi:hypothetical protein